MSENNDPIKTSNYKRTIYVGTSGDYKPVSFYNKTTNNYIGIDIEISKLFAKEKNYNLVFVKTSWPTLMQDTLLNKFDFAICGITKTQERLNKALMTTGYLTAGKTFLMRNEDKDKYKSIADVNKSTVRVIINPGGTNEKFARENLANANIKDQDLKFTIGVSLPDCTGCGLCSEVCPGKAGAKALVMKMKHELLEDRRDEEYQYLFNEVKPKENVMPDTTVKGSQFKIGRAHV